MRILSAGTLLVLLAIAASCGGSSGVNSQQLGLAVSSQPTTHEQLMQQFPPLPMDRAVSAEYSSEVIGRETHDRSGNAILDGSALTLISGTTDISWGIWQFSDLANLSSVQAVVDVPAGEEFYLALADFSAGRWEFDGPYSAGLSIPLDELRHRSEHGNFYVAVITMGGDGATIYKFILTTESDWQIVSIDDDYCDQPSLANIGSKPAISYIGGIGAELFYVRAEDYAGASWPEPTMVTDTDTYRFASPAMLYIDSKPSVACGRGSSLTFYQATDVTGDSWAEPQVLGSSLGYIIQDVAMTLNNGYPAVAYVNRISAGYTRANNTAGTDWPELVTVAEYPTHHLNERLSLAIEFDKPILSFVNSSFEHDNLLAIRATDEKGFNWGSAEIVTGDEGVYHHHPVGAIVANLFKLATFNSQDEAIQLAEWDAGESDWVHSTVVGGDKTGSYRELTMAIIDSKPAICYYSEDEAALMYVSALDSTGSTWGEPVIVDRFGYRFPRPSSMIEISWKPAIAYVVSPGELRFAYLVGP